MRGAQRLKLARHRDRHLVPGRIEVDELQHNRRAIILGARATASATRVSVISPGQVERGLTIAAIGSNTSAVTTFRRS